MFEQFFEKESNNFIRPRSLILSEVFRFLRKQKFRGSRFRKNAETCGDVSDFLDRVEIKRDSEKTAKIKMFGNFFNFQSKNKDGKAANKDESSKKSKNKKGKDGKKESAVEETDVAKLSAAEVIKNDDDEHFEEIRPTSAPIDNDVGHETVSNDVIERRSDRQQLDVPSVPELLLQLEQVENEARRLADGLEQVRFLSMLGICEVIPYLCNKSTCPQDNSPSMTEDIN